MNHPELVEGPTTYIPAYSTQLKSRCKKLVAPKTRLWVSKYNFKRPPLRQAQDDSIIL
jgi:hypothetical protein